MEVALSRNPNWLVQAASTYRGLSKWLAVFTRVHWNPAAPLEKVTPLERNTIYIWCVVFVLSGTWPLVIES